MGFGGYLNLTKLKKVDFLPADNLNSCRPKYNILAYTTLHYKAIYSGLSKKLQGPLWRMTETVTE